MPPMKAYFIQSGSKETTLELREVPRPQAGPGQVLVRVRAASLNRGEFLAAHGLTKPGAAKPAGTDGAGEVEGTGERVMGRLPGAFAEYALMDQHDVMPVPSSLSWEEAAAVPLTFLVVHDMLLEQGDLKPGEWLLVTGVSSGVGVAALQAAKALGAKVIGTSGSSEKLSRLKTLGLDLGIQTRKADFHDAVLQATGGKGVDLVVNNVGGTVFAECVRCLGYGGRLATVGYLDGSMKSEIDLDALHSKRLKLFGVSNKLRNGPQRAVTVQGFVRDFLPLFASGKLKPLIDKVYDFKDLPAAKARMEADAQTGKLVVRIP
ncbi:MAG: Alcohol dehydrogenase, zinc-binding protein [Burkholderiales bacterium]|nr:Alcohol dehydrogenase, zinc-binding protein [Burkholderiales bacterium]